MPVHYARLSLRSLAAPGEPTHDDPGGHKKKPLKAGTTCTALTASPRSTPAPPANTRRGRARTITRPFWFRCRKPSSIRPFGVPWGAASTGRRCVTLSSRVGRMPTNTATGLTGCTSGIVLFSISRRDSRPRSFLPGCPRGRGGMPAAHGRGLGVTLLPEACLTPKDGLPKGSALRRQEGR
jgi:hypothetical protein